MADRVKRRSYDSSRRQANAQQNRARVLAAARRSFLEHGYAGTTIAAVAADADVSVETVYKAFRNKAGLLKRLFDVAIAGDDEPVPVLERDWVARISAEPDARSKLRMYADGLSARMLRAAPVQLIVRSVAAVDDEIAALWRQMNEERLTGMTAFATHLHDDGHLRAGVTLEDARDILWTYISVEVYELLVLERGWSIPRYRDFVADALIAALVETPSAPA